MYKRGQFFLIAALVIVGIVTGLAAVYNTATVTREDNGVYDLSDEIELEGSHLLDYGQLNPGQDINKHVLGIMEQYVATNPDIEFSVIVKDQGEQPKCLVCRASNRGSVVVGSASTGIDKVACQEDRFLNNQENRKLCQQTNDDDVEIKLGEGRDADFFRFDLKGDRGFYVILDRQRDGERFVGGSVKPERTRSGEDPKPDPSVCNRDNECDDGENHGNCPQDCPKPLFCEPDDDNEFIICHEEFDIKITMEGLTTSEFDEHTTHSNDACDSCSSTHEEVITCGQDETFTPDLSGYDKVQIRIERGCTVITNPISVRENSLVFVSGGNVEKGIFGENSVVFVQEESTIGSDSVNAPVTIKGGKLVVRSSRINGQLEAKSAQVVDLHNNVVTEKVASVWSNHGSIVGNAIHSGELIVCDPEKVEALNNVDIRGVEIASSQTPGVCTQFG